MMEEEKKHIKYYIIEKMTKIFIFVSSETSIWPGPKYGFMVGWGVQVQSAGRGKRRRIFHKTTP
jgi:hypothetical protein